MSRSKVITRLGRRRSPRLAMTAQVPPISKEQEEEEQNLIPNYICTRDEVLGTIHLRTRGSRSNWRRRSKRRRRTRTRTRLV